VTAGRYWLALALVALGTLAFRLVFLGTRRSPRLPDFLRRAMDFVPPAVLAALVVPQFLRPANPDWPVLAAGVAAILAAFFSRRDFLSIVAGFLAYGLVSSLLG
jgi:branched-subunit amino acid transport protein